MGSLPAMLAHVFVDLGRAYAEEARRADGPDVPLLVWSNLLRVVPQDGITLRDLPAAARVSRRVVKTLLVRHPHWLEVDDVAPRVKLVRLTAAGAVAQGRGERLVQAADATWSSALGVLADRLRAALATFVAGLDLELPHHPMPYGPADPSALGGRAVAAREGPPRIPPHGTDWVPVLRTDPGSVTALSLPALVSQALMAFTVDVEERVGFPFGLAGSLSRTFADDRPVPISDLPPALGVDGSGRTLLERHGIVSVGKASGGAASGARGRPVTLTFRGRSIRDALPAAVEAVPVSWRARHGEAVVDDLVASLAAVDAQLPEGLPDLVAVRFVPGVGLVDVWRASGSA